MSYCVNCGVKLAASEGKCPLCNTVVYNPNEDVVTERPKVYSARVEEYPHKKLNVKYIAQIILVIIGIGILVQTLCNVLVNGEISWSLYGIGAFVLFACFSLPLLTTKLKSPYIATIIDLVALALYIYLIALMTDGELWYFEFYLPIHLFVSVYIWLSVVFLRKKRRNFFRVGGMTFLFLSFLLILIELLLDVFIVGKIYLIWSLCCAPPLLAIAVLLLVIAGRPKWREELSRRMYMNY